MVIQDLSNNDRRDAIISYIIKNDGCTKTKVITAMKTHSAVQTTHNIIHNLINEGMVIVKKDPKNRQIHHLHINNKFASLDTEINQIEKIMSQMDIPIRAYLKLRPQDIALPTKNSLPNLDGDTNLSRKIADPDKKEKYTISDDIYHHFIFPYEEAVSMMLHILFKRISETVLTEKDADKLRRRVVILLVRLTTQIFNITKEREYLDDSIWWLKTFRLPTTKQFAERNRIDLSIRQELVQTIQKFEGKFL